MISQESTYRESDLTDFSSALLRTNAKNNVSRSKKNSASNAYTSSDNHNLSGVLSQIQDDGPAFSDTTKRDNLVNLKIKNNTTQQIEKNSELNKDDFQSYSTNELLRKAIVNADGADIDSKNRTSPQLLLMLLATVITVTSLFMVYTKTSDMEEALNLYTVKLNDSAASQNNDLPPEITSINKTLQSVQKELKLIKKDYPVTDEKYLATLTSKISPKIDEAVAIKDNVSILEIEIMELKSELQTVSTELKSISNNKVIEEKEVAVGAWIVNLASLASKYSADNAVKQLIAAGLSPSLQEAVVNGERIYRLSVGGFKNRSDAELFVREAGKKYGMKNGWIRKS